MNEEKTNIVPYNNTPKDYSNSNRSKMGVIGQPVSGPPAQTTGSAGRTDTGAKTDGFFKATLKQAVDHAVKTVVDPMIRNFLYSTGMSVLNTMLWNGKKGSPGFPTPLGMTTPYNLISTPSIGTGAQQKQPQMTHEDRVWQNYEKLHTETLEKAQAIMSRLYRTFRRQGQVKLAEYYEAFGEKYAFEDENWGWTSLPSNRMYAQQFSDGYHVIMPKLERL